jgi:dihydrofolate synthase/folylpolyglutamate synthase
MGRIFNTVNEGFLWIESFSNRESEARENKRVYRLERMAELCRYFDNPQECYKIVHLAGSKGKGSTAAMIASLLSQGGIKTGLYTSPHLSDYRERIQIILNSNSRFVSSEALIAHMERIKAALDGGLKLTAGLPTTFELLTLLGFLSYAGEECQWVVLETGLGGRLDATNVCRPELTLITPIELEHTILLGDTLERIAGEKGGIIKEKIPLILSYQQEEVTAKILTMAHGKQAPVTRVDSLLKSYKISYKKGGLMRVDYSWLASAYPDRISLTMVGPVQAENSAMALIALKMLRPNLSRKCILEGLKKACLPGRSQVISRKPLIILDGAHTPRSIEAIVKAFDSLAHRDTPRVLIFGCALDKDASTMIALLAGHFDKVIISPPGTYKKSDTMGLEKMFLTHGPCERIESHREALAKARETAGPGGSLLVTGSFYLAGEIYDVL